MPAPDPVTTDWVPIGPPGPGVPAGGTTAQALIKKTATDYDLQWGNAGADLIYDGDYSSGPTYKDGEIVVYNGVAYICTMPTSSPPSAWPGAPPVTQPPATVTGYGTTLPASPYDGQEYVLVDSTTNPSWQWRFRYNAASTSAYKWEFVGGDPAGSQAGDQNINHTANVWVAVPGVTAIPISRAGEYRIRVGALLQNIGTFPGAYNIGVRPYRNTAADLIGQAAEFIATAQFSGGTVALDWERMTLAAGVTVGLASYSNVTNTNAVSRAWVIVQPRRVS